MIRRVANYNYKPPSLLYRSIAVRRSVSPHRLSNHFSLVSCFRETAALSLFARWYAEIDRTQGKPSHSNFQVCRFVRRLESIVILIFFSVTMISKSLRIRLKRFFLLTVPMSVPVATMDPCLFGTLQRAKRNACWTKSTGKCVDRSLTVGFFSLIFPVIALLVFLNMFSSFP